MHRSGIQLEMVTQVTLSQLWRKHEMGASNLAHIPIGTGELRVLALFRESPLAAVQVSGSVHLEGKVTSIARRPPKQYIDFNHVAPSHYAIHDRLENWARWCRGRPGFDQAPPSPMFQLYRSTEAKRAYGDETSVPVDKLDAQAVAKAVAMIPDKHRRAIHWCYLRPKNPNAMARELGVGLEGLAHLVRDGRQMLINKRA